MGRIVNGVANDFEFETLNKEKINIYELGDIPNIYLIEELQERIDKAIKYIEKYKTEDYCDGMSAKQLLDILKGDNK